MRTGKIGRRKYYARYISHYTKRNYALIGLGALFLAGVLAGALLPGFADADRMSFVRELLTGFVERRRTQPISGNFYAAAASSLIFVGAMFFCGFCAIGQPAALLAPLFKGLGFGISVASLYSAYGAGAAGYVGLFLLPGTVITTVALLICCRESLRLSTRFWRMARPNGGESGAYPLRIYTARYIVAAAVCLISAALEAFIYYLFANSVVLG
ncbi:MAG: hypothetical protein FWH02_04370 [Oscillospiraceae bacterium]|nr:hypothetical protein [Oscillospiraceae bacterium]